MALHSIRIRLIFGSGFWIVGALVITGLILTQLFRDHVERGFDARLNAHMLELLVLIEVAPEGSAALAGFPTNPDFDQPFSGWYWTVLSDGNQERSRSLWDETLSFPESISSSEGKAFTMIGPLDRRVRVLTRRFTVAGTDSPVDILVAGPESQIEETVGQFASSLILSLTLLGLWLLGAVLLQVHFGLKPLRKIRSRLTAIRSGKAERLGSDFPVEIAPLAADLDALLESHAQVIERARTQAGNLAHALKTPLSVITNEADGMEGDAGDVIRGQAENMRRQIDWHLRRAHAAGARDIPGLRAEVALVLAGLTRTLRRLYEERNLTITVDLPDGSEDGAAFHGEHQDLAEMLGNLMNNACKWARSQVLVTAARHDGRLIVTVDDDGPGIPEKRRSEAIGRGRRLDEAVPGNGLGLSIVSDIADLYGGKLLLGVSPWGGLSATLELPLAG